MAEIPSAYHEFNQIIFTDCGMNALFNIGECDQYVNGTQLFNYGPNAIAGQDQIINTGETAVLDASNSYDQDGEIESYNWAQVGGVSINIQHPDSVIAQLSVPEQGGPIDIKLTVIDNDGAQSTDTIRVIINEPPTARAGEDQHVVHSGVVLLDGSESNDTNGEVTGFFWEQIGGAPVSVFSSNQQIATFFSSNAQGTLSFVLSVNDEQGLSDKDTTMVFVSLLSINEATDIPRKNISLSPNPFNSSLLISYLNQSNFLTNNIVVYDILGKEIVNWPVLNSFNTENHIYWDGKDGRGFEIRAGLYFVRFESKNNSIIKKVTHLK
jgi:hypothetical protein